MSSFLNVSEPLKVESDKCHYGDNEIIADYV